jgi:hypothetical protein
MASSNIDNILERMPHKAFTRIQGEPSFETLETIQKELRANAKAIHSTLGGGAQGHLGLVMTPAAYAHVSPTAFVMPAHPGHITIAVGTSAHVAAAMRDTHSAELGRFNTAQAVLSVLKAQIKAAFDLDFLDEELDEDTDDFIHDVPTTIQNLFTEYGKVEPAIVREKEQEIIAAKYNPELPMGPLFKTTDKLMTLADAANIPYTPEQRMQIVKDIFKETRCFGRAIEKWNLKPLADKTWTNFKTHFKDARKTMKAAGTLNSSTSAFHSAHLMRQIVVDGMQQVLQQHPAHPFAGNMTTDDPFTAPYEYQTQPSQYPTSASEDATTITSNTSNASSSQPYQDNLSAFYTAASKAQEEQAKRQKEFEDKMLKMLTQMTKANKPPTTSTRTYNNPNDTRPVPANPRGHNKYCYSHGLCNHDSNNCNSKASGHKDNATYWNRLGGTYKSCPDK